MVRRLSVPSLSYRWRVEVLRRSTHVRYAVPRGPRRAVVERRAGSRGPPRHLADVRWPALGRTRPARRRRRARGAPGVRPRVRGARVGGPADRGRTGPVEEHHPTRPQANRGTGRAAGRLRRPGRRRLKGSARGVLQQIGRRPCSSSAGPAITRTARRTTGAEGELHPISTPSASPPALRSVDGVGEQVVVNSGEPPWHGSGLTAHRACVRRVG